ncbi:hypothetical protein [Haliovirga abyssi]|uniref:Carboxypeptidase regulatory-like domain-containing protein n=1 Tax=Haliovirga abyssi TaxID=2996794 RepID=A0AAU9DSF2_9FUSO|nr:hypothetical protein [Haliovirga abyssi]BDU49944.1 hypothetical protein HLVA_05130 [Haliovirga abyssi]
MKKILRVLLLITISISFFGCFNENSDDSNNLKRDLENKISIKVKVLNSVAGNNISNSAIKVYMGEEILGEAKTDKNGDATIYLDKDLNGNYIDVVATKKGYGTSKFQDLKLGRDNEGTITLYNFKSLLKEYQDRLEAPTIEKVEVLSNDDKDGSYKTLFDEQNYENKSIDSVKIQAKAKIAMEKTEWGTQGIRLDINSNVTRNSYKVSNYQVRSEEIKGSNPKEYLTVAEFDTGYNLIKGENYIKIHVQDLAGNNTTKYVYLTALKGVELKSSEIKETTAKLFSYEFMMYAKSYVQYLPRTIKYAEINRGFSNFDLEPTIGYVSLKFSVRDKDNTYIPIKGFEVYRSEDNKNFTKVGEKFYTEATIGELDTDINDLYKGVDSKDKPKHDEYGHKYIDSDSTLEEGKVYYYKIKAFSEKGVLMTNVVKGRFLSSFKVVLEGPENNGKVDKISPTFKFKIDGMPSLKEIATNLADKITSRSAIEVEISNLETEIKSITDETELKSKQADLENKKAELKSIKDEIFDTKKGIGDQFRFKMAIEDKLGDKFGSYAINKGPTYNYSWHSFVYNVETGKFYWITDWKYTGWWYKDAGYKQGVEPDLENSIEIDSFRQLLAGYGVNIGEVFTINDDNEIEFNLENFAQVYKDQIWIKYGGPLDLTLFEKGKTYEWDVFGYPTYSGYQTAPQFIEDYSTDDVYGRSIIYTNKGAGNNADNGRYTFIVSEDAN